MRVTKESNTVMLMMTVLSVLQSDLYTIKLSRLVLGTVFNTGYIKHVM